MCQAYFRHLMSRATSFQLFNIGQIDDIKYQKREHSSHWKKKYDPVTGKIVFKKKVGYDSYNEAVMAVKKVKKDQPWDKVNWGIYVCPKCGKYHIGHQHLGNNPKPIVEADIKPEELLLHVG